MVILRAYYQPWKTAKCEVIQDASHVIVNGSSKVFDHSKVPDYLSASLRVPRPRNPTTGPGFPHAKPPANITRFTANAIVSGTIILIEQSNPKLTITDG